MDLKNYITKLISKDKRLYYYQDNIVYACQNLNKEQIFNIIPLLDNDNYFYYFSFDWRKNLYNYLQDREKLKLLFTCYTLFFVNNTELEKIIIEEYDNIWQYQKKYYINQFENFILNHKIIENKDMYNRYTKYLNFKKNIQLPDGEIIDLKTLILSYLQNKKKISKKTILYLNNNYLNEMKICKFYLMKK